MTVPGLLNPLAPLWQSSQIPDVTPSGFRDFQRDYAITLTVTATGSAVVSPPLLAQPLQLDHGADWLLCEIAGTTIPSDVDGTAVAIRIKYPNGRWLCSDYVALPDLVGPVFPVQPLPGGGILLIDALILGPQGAGTVSTQLYLIGRKRVRI